ncbi:hypothetical protein [Georgenia satyanarayanai]|uniref:hypothetical protein n=1 Tax=Georgenia satyanarayanai TaxID=860221 RepID=UPI0012646862|nr:hypothetical protein [Georgenia satyanarayanai]
MQWSPETIAEVAHAYRTNYVLSKGDRQDRLIKAERYFWAAEAVMDASMDGTLPVELIDALLHLLPQTKGSSRTSLPTRSRTS